MNVQLIRREEWDLKGREESTNYVGRRGRCRRRGTAIAVGRELGVVGEEGFQIEHAGLERVEEGQVGWTDNQIVDEQQQLAPVGFIVATSAKASSSVPQVFLQSLKGAVRRERRC